MVILLLGFIGGLSLFEFSILFLPFLFWIFTIADILKSDFKNSANKSAWLLVVILLPIIGLLFYYSLGRKQKLN